MKLYCLIVLAFTTLIACQSSKENGLDAQSIVNKAIETSGTKNFKNAKISFEFRDKVYSSENHCGRFTYHRVTNVSDSVIKDIYKPAKGLRRFIQDSLIKIADTSAQKYAESINSVFYFVQLPLRLNDKAVNKKYLGLDTIKDKVYHKIAVSFDQEGGGTDFEDKYLYWFDKDNYKLDYLAYSFKVNGGGIRFREAYNERYIEGVRFVDYKNYRPKSDKKLKNISRAYNNKNLELLSKIENKNVEVEIFNKKC